MSKVSLNYYKVYVNDEATGMITWSPQNKDVYKCWIDGKLEHQTSTHRDALIWFEQRSVSNNG